MNINGISSYSKPHRSTSLIIIAAVRHDQNIQKKCQLTEQRPRIYWVKV